MDERFTKLRLVDLVSLVECAGCACAVEEFVAIRDRWMYWSDGTMLRPFCPDCAKREFAQGPSAKADDGDS